MTTDTAVTEIPDTEWVEYHLGDARAIVKALREWNRSNDEIAAGLRKVAFYERGQYNFSKRGAECDRFALAKSIAFNQVAAELIS